MHVYHCLSNLFNYWYQKAYFRSIAMSLLVLQSRKIFYAFEPSPVASSVIHIHILKGAFTSHSTMSAAHWAQHPMQQQQGHLRQVICV